MLYDVSPTPGLAVLVLVALGAPLLLMATGVVASPILLGPAVTSGSGLRTVVLHDVAPITSLALVASLALLALILLVLLTLLVVSTLGRSALSTGVLAAGVTASPSTATLALLAATVVARVTLLLTLRFGSLIPLDVVAAVTTVPFVLFTASSIAWVLVTHGFLGRASFRGTVTAGR